jgi:aspartyl-tRNA(Asn)/glutamyl-tRNA(Gln) amidotransferase subunit B
MATVSSALLGTDLTAAQVAEREGLNVRADARELETWCREAIAANPKSLADFKAGKDSAINGFKGSVMRAAKGKADPRLVDETLRRLLAAS